jgi:hypothetical protein
VPICAEKVQSLQRDLHAVVESRCGNERHRSLRLGPEIYQSTRFNRDWLASNHLDPDLPLESVIGD